MGKILNTSVEALRYLLESPNKNVIETDKGALLRVDKHGDLRTFNIIEIRKANGDVWKKTNGEWVKC